MSCLSSTRMTSMSNFPESIFCMEVPARNGAASFYDFNQETDIRKSILAGNSSDNNRLEKCN